MNKIVEKEALQGADAVSTAPHVLTAINAVMAEVAREGIGKDRKNEQQGYKFRGIDDVYNALAPILARNHLIITPSCRSREKESVQTAKGGTLFYVTVDMDFELASALDGSTKTARMFGEAMDSGDKATNKAMSAAYKYMAMQEFCIPTTGDNDADATTHEIAAPNRPNLAVTAAQTAITMANSRVDLKRWKAANEGMLADMSPADNNAIVRSYTERWNALGPPSPPPEEAATFRDRSAGSVAGRAGDNQAATTARQPRAEDMIPDDEIPF